MPGGTGPVDDAVVFAGANRSRALGAANSANEIFFNLDPRHAYFDSDQGHLYFVEAPDRRVTRTLSRVLGDARPFPRIEQMHLDAHRCFAAACRIRLDDPQARAVLVALRLAGVRISIGGRGIQAG